MASVASVPAALFAPQASPAAALEARSAAERVSLIVDASATIQATLAARLGRLGADAERVHVATSLDAAVAAFDRVRPDVVFLECDIANGAGATIAAALLARDPLVKIVVMTANGPDCPVVRDVVRMGAFAVLPKPLRVATVRAVLDDVELEDGQLDRLA